MSEEQNDDQYLIHSDVFLSTEEETNDGKFLKNSIQFFIILNENNQDVSIDDDGDLDLYRPERIDLTLVHRNETNVAECGYQLWNGALLLCDYILTNQDRFLNKTILELGAGIGLCTLIASRFASKIICTDYDNDLLELIKQNIKMNNNVCKKECIQIQKCDWKEFNSNEIDNEIEIILAADVIYDDELTDVLFNVFSKLFEDKPKLCSIYITIEKRINFYLETLSVQCPAYEYFLEKLNLFKINMPMVNIEEMNTDLKSIKQCTAIYKRTKELMKYLIFLLTIVSARDWLVDKITDITTLTTTPLGTLLLSNTLISREFLIVPDFATIDFRDLHTTDSSLLRCVKPEALITLDGIEYNIGGVKPNTQCAYFNRTDFWKNKALDTMAFHFSTYEVGIPKAPFAYTPKRSAPVDIQWPPKGIHLSVYFKAPYYAPLSHKYVTVVVNYEMYDGIPLLAKWLDVIDTTGRGDIDLSFNSIEILAVNQPWSPYGHSWLYIETDQPPGHGTNVVWTNDVEINTIPGSFPPLVNCTYQTDHEIVAPLVTQLTSFHVHELVIGSSDEERTALSKHRLMRLLAPHTQENPIFFHMTNGSSSAFRQAIDQMAEVGFEMLIYSFGSGFDMESNDEKYINQIASDIAYAKSKGIEVGGYDLIALTRGVQASWMAIDPNTGKPRDSACFASGWYDYLLNRTLTFMDRTGLIMVETDGPYGGYSCASTTHSHHRNNDDSIYQQNILQGNYYKILRERSVYINQPDYYFYQGGSKTGMGYNEEQYSLPRWMDISVSRQGMFDDTYQRIPTIGWMFVPLTVYHGGGEAAQFEPLIAHQIEYEWALAQYLGAGVAACYRGYRLYDSPQTQALVTKWVNFYKKYRSIIIRDIIHVRRADMQSIDSYMHVDPYSNDIKGLAMVFNPTSDPVETILPVPLYYTGLTDTAQVSEQENPWKNYPIARDYHIDLPISLPPLGITWFLIK